MQLFFHNFKLKNCKQTNTVMRRGIESKVDAKTIDLKKLRCVKMIEIDSELV